MRKPAKRAPQWEPEPEPPPEPKPAPWHWKAVVVLLAAAFLMAGLALAKSTATDAEMERAVKAAQSATAAIDTTIDSIEANYDKMDASISRIDAMLDEISANLAAYEASLDAAPVSGAELDQYVVKVALGQGHGSGVVIGDGTYVLTAGHVAEAAGPEGQVVIVRQDGTAVDGEVLWIALQDDIALIKIEEKLPAAKLSCEAPKVSEAVEVVGHPGFGETLDWLHSNGHVMQVYDNGYGARPGRRVLFFDANAYFGNSGGPLFNAKGEVIGIVSALLGVNVGGAFSSMVVPFGYNIAVPTDVACGMMPL